jgi:hypothetical protein
MMDPGEFERLERASERPGWQAEPLAGGEVAPELFMALEAAITAGACRRAAALNPDRAMIWNAVAEARRGEAIVHLRAWAIARAKPVGRSRA